MRLLFLILLAFLVSASTEASAQSNSGPVRIGMIGLDTSHSVRFTELINDPAGEGLTARYEVVAAYPYGSMTVASSYDRIPRYVAEMRDLGVDIVGSVRELLDRVDVVMLETNDGKPHLRQALEVIGAGKPLFVDKPVAASLEDVIAIYKAAERAEVPLFSSSSLRWAVNAQNVRAGSAGDVTGAFAYSPAPLEPSHVDLYWYGIHGVELLYTVMGPGCETITRSYTEGLDGATCIWEDGRVGSVFGIRDGRRGYGGTAFGADSIASIGPSAGNAPLIQAVLEFFETGEAPVDPEETIEIYAFMSAADESKRRGGEPVRLDSVLAAAAADAEQRLAAASALASRGGADARPNILFVFTDDHASHAIGAYGGPLEDVAPTPNIDRLADEGMLFRNAFVTNSICAPSRAVILTGKHSHLNGVIDNRATFDGSQTTFPKLLRETGYETAIVGKWHLKSDPTGFDYWNVLAGQGAYYNPEMIENGVRKSYTGYTTDIITEQALHWLEYDRDPSKPFMMMYQHKAPHRDWEPGPDHLTMFDDVDIPEPATLFEHWVDRTTAADWQAMTIERHLTPNDLKLTPRPNLTEEQQAAWNAAYGPKNAAFREAGLEGEALVRWKYQRYMKDYLRTVASVDDNLGRVLDYLDETGLADNTIVIYSSDQGFYLGDHGWFDKRWMYEESLRMPLVVRWPGVTDAGAENTELVQNLDFAPTFLDAAGVDVPYEMQGRSLVPLLKGRTPGDWREGIYYHYYEFPGWHDVRRHYGVRTDRYKLIYYYGIDEWELFDLESDPDELDSVYGEAGYEDVTHRLKEMLDRLRDQYDLNTFDEAPTAPDPREVRSEVVFERTEPSLPEAIPAEDVDPTYRPLTISARVRPTSGTGVILSHGGELLGYSLYLKDGVPHFTLNNRRVYFQVDGADAIPTNTWTSLSASIDASGVMRLYIDGELKAEAAGNLMSAQPAEGITVGDDPSSKIADYGIATEFDGRIADVSLNWGTTRIINRE